MTSPSTRRLHFSGPGTLRSTVRTAKTPLLVGPTEALWATRTPHGAGTLQLSQVGDNAVDATAWGPGTDWLLDQAPALLGEADTVEEFSNVVRQLPAPLIRRWRTSPFRLARTDRVWDSTVGAVFGQRVQTTKASQSRRLLARRFGEPAPGPHRAWILPGPDTVAGLAYHHLHRLGVERTRADTLIRAARELARSERAGHDSDEMVRRLAAVRGIGPWSIGLIRATALGDADAVPTGDYHLPNTIAWNLAGEERADDARMLELLEPFSGHRWRVMLLAKGAGKAPAYGPRLSLVHDGLSMAR